MSLIPWRNKRHENGGQLASVATFRDEMDRIFDSFFHDPIALAGSSFGYQEQWNPTLDVSEKDDEVTVRAEIPGVKPEDLDVTVSGDLLTLAGEKKETLEKKEGGYFHSESRYGAFRRQVQLPAEVDAENVAAHYADGVLTVRLRKTSATKAKRIVVNAG